VLETPLFKNTVPGLKLAEEYLMVVCYINSSKNDGIKFVVIDRARKA
jgi:hypothetical protein